MTKLTSIDMTKYRLCKWSGADPTEVGWGIQVQTAPKAKYVNCAADFQALIYGSKPRAKEVIKCLATGATCNFADGLVKMKAPQALV